MKQVKHQQNAETVGEIISDRNINISLYIEWLSMGIASIDELIGRIKKDGLARVSVGEFFPSLENLGRECFISWVEDIENRCWATPKYRDEYFELYRRYSCKLGKLTQAIKDCLPNSQQAQQLAAAIDRLDIEVSDAIARGTEQYTHGKGKPQPADLLSDTRHGALWDSVENAIIALSTAKGETNADICAAVRAEVRGLKSKSDAKETRRKQREDAAKWLKAERAAGKKASRKKASIGDAANYVDVENNEGGYTTTAALLTALQKNAAALGIEQFITRRNKYKPRKR